jgi:hypothetical protein
MLLQAREILYTRGDRELMEDIFRFVVVPCRPVRAFCIQAATPFMYPPNQPERQPDDCVARTQVR